MTQLLSDLGLERPIIQGPFGGTYSTARLTRRRLERGRPGIIRGAPPGAVGDPRHSHRDPPPYGEAVRSQPLGLSLRPRRHAPAARGGPAHAQGSAAVLSRTGHRFARTARTQGRLRCRRAGARSDRSEACRFQFYLRESPLRRSSATVTATVRSSRASRAFWPHPSRPRRAARGLRKVGVFARSQGHASYLPTEALRRSSSKKLSRNVRCVTGFSPFGLSATRAARCLPSGARS